MIEKNFDEENRKKFQKELDRLKKKQEVFLLKNIFYDLLNFMLNIKF